MRNKKMEKLIKFGKFAVRHHIDGRIVAIGKDYIIIHGDGVDDYNPCGKNIVIKLKDLEKHLEYMLPGERAEWEKFCKND